MGRSVRPIGLVKDRAVGSSDIDLWRITMELGAFSVSLAVKDMAVSRTFYEKLGFAMVAGDGESWTIMANQATAIGLFYDMFRIEPLDVQPRVGGPRPAG